MWRFLSKWCRFAPVVSNPFGNELLGSPVGEQGFDLGLERVELALARPITGGGANLLNVRGLRLAALTPATPPPRPGSVGCDSASLHATYIFITSL